MIVSEKSSKDNAMKIAIRLNLLGDKSVFVFNTFKFDEEGDKKKLDPAVKRIKDNCVPRTNAFFEH